MDLQGIQKLASKQHGVISRQQSEDFGLSRRTWFRMNSDGRLLPRHPNVSSLFGFQENWLQRVEAAVLALDHRGIASHRTAAVLWGVWTLDETDEIEVIKLGRSGHPFLEGVKVHSPRDHQSIAPLKIENIRVTNATRTMVDFAAVEPHLISDLAERMLLAGHVEHHHIVRAVALHSERGRAGVGPLRELLAQWPYGTGPAESILEMRMQKLLSQTELPPYEMQVVIGPYRVDFAWSRFKVIAETDGWAKIKDLAAIEKWMKRDAYLQSQGWLVLHFSWRQVVKQPGQVVRTIFRALASRGTPSCGSGAG